MIAARGAGRFAAIHRSLTALKPEDTRFERVLLALTLPVFVLISHRSIGSLPYQVFWAFAYGASLLGVLASPYRHELVRRSLPLVAFVALMVLSTAWSTAPKVTLLQSVRLFGTTAIAYYLVTRFTLREFVELFGMAMAALLASSVLFVGVGVECHNSVPDAYGMAGWCGVFAHKNALGGGMVLGIVTLALMWFSSRGMARWAVAATLAGCIGLLAGSRSATSIVSCGIVLACLALMRLWYLRKNGRALILGGGALLAVGLGCAFVFGADFDSFFEAFGRDSSLTGRLDFWPNLVEAIRSRPWLGFGYNAFFAYGPDSPGDYFLAEYHMNSRWYPPIAHNGLLQVALDVGLAGVVLLGASVLAAVRGAFALIARHRHDSFYMWPALILLYFGIVNCTESDIAQYNEIFWVVFVAALLYATVPRVRERVATAPAPGAPVPPPFARRDVDRVEP
jgi:O-antigen ligase